MQQPGNVIGNAADLEGSPDAFDKINYLNSPSNRRGNNELEGADEEIAQEEEAAEDEEEELNAEMLDNGE
jgi:hypothetical protein